MTDSGSATATDSEMSSTGSEEPESSSSSTGEPDSTTTSGPPGTSTTDDSGVDSATTNACMEAPMGSTPLGEECTDGCECASGICFALPLLGSACSECLTDAECQSGGPGTCSINPATNAAICTAGELGVMCDPASNGCAEGLQCVQLVDTQGALPDTFCSECATDADCGADVCVPNVVIEGVQPGGFHECAVPGSAADGSFCPASGDAAACASGFCFVVDIAGLGVADIGVCGPCAMDADCSPGMTCQPAMVDENGAVASQCV